MTVSDFIKQLHAASELKKDQYPLKFIAKDANGQYRELHVKTVTRNEDFVGDGKWIEVSLVD